jgi:hypothetical protein
MVRVSDTTRTSREFRVVPCVEYMDPARLQQADWIRCNRHKSQIFARA